MAWHQEPPIMVYDVTDSSGACLVWLMSLGPGGFLMNQTLIRILLGTLRPEILSHALEI